MSVSDWADHKALELLPQGKCEDGGNIRVFIARALRDVQRDTAEECLRLAEALYDADGVTNERICTAIRERFLKEGK